MSLVVLLPLPRRMSAAVSPSAVTRWFFLLSFLATCLPVEASDESLEPVGGAASSPNAAPEHPSSVNRPKEPKSLSEKFHAKLNYITERYPHVAPFSSAKEWLRGDPAPFRCPGVPKAATFKAKYAVEKHRTRMITCSFHA